MQARPIAAERPGLLLLRRGWITTGIDYIFSTATTVRFLVNRVPVSLVMQ